MLKKLVIFLFVGIINGLPPGIKPTNDQKSSNQGSNIQPEVLTIERLEALLKKASEIFKPSTEQQFDVPTADIQKVTVPIQYLQPPANQPFNFYLPLYGYGDSEKVDDKSRNLEHLTPPPAPNEDKRQENFYDIKPKKNLPKKFNASAKHINIKWLNAYEKQLSSSNNKESIKIPKDVYLLNDEKNRINFEDNFFAVDMKVPDRTNKLDKSLTEADNQNDDYISQGEEDLIAAAALQIPFITQFTTIRKY